VGLRVVDVCCLFTPNILPTPEADQHSVAVGPERWSRSGGRTRRQAKISDAEGRVRDSRAPLVRVARMCTGTCGGSAEAASACKLAVPLTPRSFRIHLDKALIQASLAQSTGDASQA